MLFLPLSLSNENGGGLLAARDRFEHRRSCFAKALGPDVGGDIHRTNFSRLCKSFHSFRSIGFATFAILSDHAWRIIDEYSGPDMFRNEGKFGPHFKEHFRRPMEEISRIGPFRASIAAGSVCAAAWLRTRLTRAVGRTVGNDPIHTLALARKAAGEALTEIGQWYNVSHSTVSRLA